ANERDDTARAMTMIKRLTILAIFRRIELDRTESILPSPHPRPQSGKDHGGPERSVARAASNKRSLSRWFKARFRRRGWARVQAGEAALRTHKQARGI